MVPGNISLILRPVALYEVTGAHAMRITITYPDGSTYWRQYNKNGWRYKNAEPSETALAANHIGGILAALPGVILLFV